MLHLYDCGSDDLHLLLYAHRAVMSAEARDRTTHTTITNIILCIMTIMYSPVMIHYLTFPVVQNLTVGIWPIARHAKSMPIVHKLLSLN